jgi:hypothetical protein
MGCYFRSGSKTICPGSKDTNATVSCYLLPAPAGEPTAHVFLHTAPPSSAPTSCRLLHHCHRPLRSKLFVLLFCPFGEIYSFCYVSRNKYISKYNKTNVPTQQKTTSNLDRMEYIIVNDFLNIITNRYVLRSSTYF